MKINGIPIKVVDIRKDDVPVGSSIIANIVEEKLSAAVLDSKMTFQQHVSNIYQMSVANSMLNHLHHNM